MDDDGLAAVPVEQYGPTFAEEAAGPQEAGKGHAHADGAGKIELRPFVP